MTYSNILGNHISDSESVDQHFREWFSGSALDAIWTVTNDAGTASTTAMADVINGGYQIVSGTTVDDRTSIHFNNINHYSSTGSILIGKTKRASTNGRVLVGLADTNDIANSPTNKAAYVDNQNDIGSYRLVTTDGGTAETSTTQTEDENWHIHRIHLQTSMVTNHFDGAFQAVNTTNLPNVALQPVFQVQAKVSGAGDGSINFMEVYNT